MKIAILTPTFSPFSGIDRVVEMRADKFAQKGHDVTIFTFRASIKPKVGLIEMGMPKKPFVERFYRLFFFLDFPKVKRYVKMLKEYDVVEGHFYPTSILASKAKKSDPKIKYIYYNYGVGSTETYSFLEKLYLKLFNYFNNKTVMNADEVISISNYLREEMLKETGKDGKVEYIEVDKKRFYPGIDGTKIRKKYNIKGPMFLYVGRISPHKGIHLLIESFKIVNKKIPDAKLVIIGKPTFKKYFEKLKKLANENVVFAGFVPDEELPYYYAACNIYTTATLWEGFDMPAVEAQECGKKVVAFDVAAHPETVKNGVLVKKGDVEGFASAIMKLL